MTIDDTAAEDMPENTDSNLLPSELALGQRGRVHIKDYERHSRSYDKTITAMHQDIIGFGRVLLTGQEMYPSRKEFGYWIERRGLNTGKLAKHQTERTACMSIARLVDVGAEVDELDDKVVPVKLDLSGCKLTTPTDIMKWARKYHRHLFPHLPPKKEKGPGEKIAGDIKRGITADIAARDETISELETELEEARQRILALESADTGPVKAANAALRLEPGQRPQLAPEGAGLSCSFCSKTATEAAVLIQGQHALICDACIELCLAVVAERKAETAQDE